MEHTPTDKVGSSALGEDKPIKMEPTNKDGSIYADADRSDFCAGGRYDSLSKRIFCDVEKNEDVSPYFIIICGYCGMEIEKDLHCPVCRREVEGKLMYNICGSCMLPVTYCHNPETCQKDVPYVHTSFTEEIRRINSPSWHPSSPTLEWFEE